jgi:flagellar motor switch protein FliN/FliY
LAKQADTVNQSGPPARAGSAPPSQKVPVTPGDEVSISANDIDVLVAAAGSGTGREALELPSDATAGGSPLRSSNSGGAPQAQHFEFPAFDVQLPSAVDAKRVSMLSDVNLRVKIELGRTRMLVEDVLKLGEGSVVELDKLAGDPVDVYANDRLVARGEVLVLDDRFCVRISDVVSRDPHRIIR